MTSLNTSPVYTAEANCGTRASIWSSKSLRDCLRVTQSDGVRMECDLIYMLHFFYNHVDVTGNALKENGIKFVILQDISTCDDSPFTCNEMIDHILTIPFIQMEKNE